MSNLHLRLVSETDRTPDSFKFEQRREPRHRLYARVTAVAHPAEEHESPNAAGQICALELVDQSRSGLGAWSIDPVALGSRVTVFFPAHAAEPGFNMTGRVVRCHPAAAGYSIGLTVESQMAAA
ncbi:MAG: PilZ domain-containing protein [Planctomycetota bacterium]